MGMTAIDPEPALAFCALEAAAWFVARMDFSTSGAATPPERRSSSKVSISFHFLLMDIPELAGECPADLRIVVFHSVPP